MKLFEYFTVSELKFFGKISLDRLNRNGLLPKLALESKIHKDEKKVFHYLLTTVETPYKLHIFFPYLFQNIMSMNQEHIEITHEHAVVGNKKVISTLCNLTNKKIIATVTPALMSIELYDGEVSLVKYVTELTKVDVGRNSMLLEGNKVVQFNAYQPWFLPAATLTNTASDTMQPKPVVRTEETSNTAVATNVAVTPIIQTTPIVAPPVEKPLSTQVESK